MEQHASDFAFAIRPYQPGDRAACRRLFIEGLIGGKIAENDIGADLDQIDGRYLKTGGFWVAQLTAPSAAGQVVGMIGVQQGSDGSSEIRRLRVDEGFRRRGIGSSLVGHALRFCREKGHLRVILDTFMEREPAVRLFEKFCFQHGRTRRVGEKDLLYFYLDLYGTDEVPSA